MVSAVANDPGFLPVRASGCRLWIPLLRDTALRSMILLSLLCLSGCSGCNSSAQVEQTQQEDRETSGESDQDTTATSQAQNASRSESGSAESLGRNQSGSASSAPESATSGASGSGSGGSGQDGTVEGSTGASENTAASASTSAAPEGPAGTTFPQGRNSGPQTAAAADLKSASPAGNGTPEDLPSADREQKGMPAPGSGQAPGPARNRPRSVAEAVQVATDLQKQSQDAVVNKNFGEAFSLAVQAWQAADTYRDDTRCKDLAVNLRRRMNELAAKANAQRQKELNQSPILIVK